MAYTKYTVASCNLCLVSREARGCAARAQAPPAQHLQNDLEGATGRSGVANAFHSEDAHQYG